MRKTFAIIGSGYRAGFYLRIAASKENEFEVAGVLCRREEKARAIAEEYGVFTTLSEQEIIDKNPDFVVVCVTKTSIAKVSAYWRGLGFTVVCETPVGLTEEDITYALEDHEKPLIVAEQYQYYKTYEKLIDIVSSKRLGDIQTVNISLAHEYHGASLMRHLLGVGPEARYRLLAVKYILPVVKTKDRYNTYVDGEIINKPRVKALIEYADGKIATYDFDSEQYRSPIRHNSVRITGTRGEIIDEKLWYLDENNVGQEENIFSSIQSVREPSQNGELTEDEVAILTILEKAYLVSIAVKDENYPDRKDILSWADDNLKNAIADADFMNLLAESDGTWVTYNGRDEGFIK